MSTDQIAAPHPTAPHTTAPRLTPPRRQRSVQMLSRRPADIPRRPWESAAVFGFFAVVYAGFGEWLVAGKHVVGFVTLDHFNRALMVWHNSPPKLSAVGFDFPPLSTIFLTPFTIITPWARTLVVVPVASAIFAAGVMVCLNTLMRRAAAPAAVRVLVLVALAGNPLVVLYASSGAGDFMPLFFALAGLGALAAWYVTADIRLVLLAGLAFAVASLAGYGTLLLFLVATLGVAAVLARNRAHDDEIEGTTVGFTVPTVYAVALWVAFGLIINHRPLGWIPRQYGTEHFTFAEIVRDTARLVLDGAPIAIVVLPALVIVGVARRDGFTLWCAAFLAATILMPGLAAAFHLTTSPMAMRDALPILLVATAGAIWLLRALPAQRGFVALALIAALVGSVPWTFSQMRTFPHQNLEAVFVNALSTGRSQDGARNQSGQIVGIGTEEDMANWIRAHVTGRDAVLTDNAQTYGVMLLSGRPGIFFDRVDESDGPWMKVARDPAGTVQFLLLTRGNQNDLLAQLYPGAAKGADRQLPVVHANARYTLVRVAPGYVRPNITSGETS
ncbi:MAG TPA: hypothetical protein VGL26_01675 [Jatrophihabitans sp.]